MKEKKNLNLEKEKSVCQRFSVEEYIEKKCGSRKYKTENLEKSAEDYERMHLPNT